MDKTDDELIAEYRNGDETAFRTLIERYLNQIQRFSFRMSNKNDTASDITQETFVKVWKNLHKYEKENTFKSWIFTIARNTAIDYLRKKKALNFSDFDNEDGKNFITETIADQDTIPEFLIEKAENKKILDDALETINPLEKEVLLLHYQEEMTFENIGKMVGEPLNTVKSRHRRALAKLRKNLEKD